VAENAAKKRRFLLACGNGRLGSAVAAAATGKIGGPADFSCSSRAANSGGVLIVAVGQHLWFFLGSSQLRDRLAAILRPLHRGCQAQLWIRPPAAAGDRTPFVKLYAYISFCVPQSQLQGHWISAPGLDRAGLAVTGTWSSPKRRPRRWLSAFA
jgi:hypothetical protein